VFQLCFKKGQIISITQREDGGWWEGTLDGKTGWFPSNYVTDCKSNQQIIGKSFKNNFISMELI
jgi:Rho guanine nucleotide exchange factor 7